MVINGWNGIANGIGFKTTISGGVVPPSIVDAILLEDSGIILLEDNSYIKLEESIENL